LSALAVACGSEDLLNTIAIAIDKLDKIGIDKVIEELQNENLNEEAIAKIKQYLQLPKGIEALGNLELICDNNEHFQKGKEELIEFVNNFSKEQFEKLEYFFLTTPKVVQEIKETCTKCGTVNETSLEGLENFFV
jgi:hydroxypyruvate isomerase